MSRIKILERCSAEELEIVVNEYIREGWKIVGNNYRVKPRSLWDDPSYSIILLQEDEPHVPADPETVALYEG